MLDDEFLKHSYQYSEKQKSKLPGAPLGLFISPFAKILANVIANINNYKYKQDTGMIIISIVRKCTEITKTAMYTT